jgi:glycerol-3-phosphate dehydrogenase
MPGFEPTSRSRGLARLADKPVDVLVIGGGITGAGVAREAALRGLAAAVVEARDFAAGTSSRSSKLIHGGLRYLQQAEVALVREAARERKVLRTIAPHLTAPAPMLVPVYGRTSAGLYKLRVGLTLFDKLAGVSGRERHRILGRDEVLAAEPLLARQHLQGAGIYPEYVTDDARLVLDTLKAAHLAGAVIANYATVTGLGSVDGLRRIEVRDEESGAVLTARARVVVNAAGPWIDALGRLEPSAAPLRLQLTKGIHLVFRAGDVPVRHSVVMRASDGRSLFTVTRGDHVYVGTTDTFYSGPLEEPAVTLADAEYLLDAVRRALPDLPIGVEQVVGTWAGIRPLIAEQGKNPSEISRKDEISVGPEGLVTIAGGKLTTYRRMAERVLEACAPTLGRRFLRTEGAGATTPLAGGDLGGAPDLETWAAAPRVRSALEGVPPDTAARLIATHGSDALEVVACAARPGDLAAIAPAVPLSPAEIRHAVRREMARTLADVLERRSRFALFESAAAGQAAHAVAAVMAPELGWDDVRAAREVDHCTRQCEARLSWRSTAPTG